MITRETGTGRFTNLVVRQTIAPLAFVDIFLAVVMALQPSSVQAGMKAATEMVDSALVFAVDVSESINTERYALP